MSANNLGLITVIAGSVIYYMLKNRKDQNSSGDNQITKSITKPIFSGNNFTINPNITINSDSKSKNIIEYYYDYQCPSCKKFQELNGNTLEKLVNDDKIILKLYPRSFLGKESVLLANATINVLVKSKSIKSFFKFNSALFSSQKKVNSGYWTNKQLINLAVKTLGQSINTTAFKNGINNSSYSKIIKLIELLSLTNKITEVPTLIINGTTIDNTITSTKIDFNKYLI
jgi:protein-disulfide isomerase